MRKRDFAISTASLAGLSLASGCSPVPGLDGEWKGAFLISGFGETFELPLSWEGRIESAGWFGSSIQDFTTYSMSMSLTIDGGEATLDKKTERVYTYTYDYGEGYDPYVADVDFKSRLTYSGPITQTGAREFDIVMGLDRENLDFFVNGEDYSDTEAPEMPHTTSAVLKCATDGTEIHCEQGSDFLIFAQD